MHGNVIDCGYETRKDVVNRAMTVTSEANLQETINLPVAWLYSTPFCETVMHGNVIECSISVDVSHYCTVLNNRQAREDFTRSFSISSRESRLYQIAQEYGFFTAYRVPCGIPFSSLKSFRGGSILTRLWGEDHTRHCCRYHCPRVFLVSNLSVGFCLL